MKNLEILIMIVVLTLTSCNNKKSQISKPLAVKTDSIELTTEFLGLFKTINPTGLHIYPPTWDINGKLIKTPFEGNPINVMKFSIVDNKDIFLNFQESKDGDSHIYAIGKFDIDKEYTGLITRQRSEYEESLIQLLIWSRKQNKIIDGIYLADSFGDAGWYFDIESWITEYNLSSTLKIVTRRKDIESGAEFESTSCTDTLKTSVFTNGKFVIKMNDLSDTTNYKLKEWK